MTTATLQAPAQLLSAETFAQQYSTQRVELVDGMVTEVPMPHPQHGKICSRINVAIANYVDEKDCGHVMTNDSFIITGRNPDRVRGADVCYFRYERLPKGPIPQGLLSVVPDLVVEVCSPSDTWSMIFVKVGEYLTAGVQVVVVLDMDTKSASVYREGTRQEIFEAHQQLVLPDILPGFEVLVGKLFE